MQGTIAELFVPLTENGDINEKAVAPMLDYLLKHGVEGLYVGGLGAEALSFTTEEKLSFLKLVKDYVSNRVPVSFLVTELSIKRALDVINEVSRIGIDVLAIPQPFPHNFGENGVINYVCELSRAFSGDIMFYNEPSVGNGLSANTVIKILDKCDNIRYYKDSTHNMIDLHAIISSHPELRVLAGSDGLIYDIMMAGGIGIVSLVINPFPELIAKIVREIREGKLLDARKTQEFIVKVRSILKMGGLTGGYRYAMSLVGIDIGRPRLPYEYPDDKTREVIKKSLTDLGLIK